MAENKEVQISLYLNSSFSSMKINTGATLNYYRNNWKKNTSTERQTDICAFWLELGIRVYFFFFLVPIIKNCQIPKSGMNFRSDLFYFLFFLCSESFWFYLPGVVCLFVCQQEYGKTTGLTFMKPGGRVESMSQWNPPSLNSWSRSKSWSRYTIYLFFYFR